MNTAPKCDKNTVNASGYIQLHTIIDGLKITQNCMEGESKRQARARELVTLLSHMVRKK